MKKYCMEASSLHHLKKTSFFNHNILHLSRPRTKLFLFPVFGIYLAEFFGSNYLISCKNKITSRIQRPWKEGEGMTGWREKLNLLRNTPILITDHRTTTTTTMITTKPNPTTTTTVRDITALRQVDRRPPPRPFPPAGFDLPMAAGAGL